MDLLASSALPPDRRRVSEAAHALDDAEIRQTVADDAGGSRINSQLGGQASLVWSAAELQQQLLGLGHHQGLTAADQTAGEQAEVDSSATAAMPVYRTGPGGQQTAAQGLPHQFAAVSHSNSNTAHLPAEGEHMTSEAPASQSPPVQPNQSSQATAEGRAGMNAGLSGRSVATSAADGSGLDELRRAIAHAAGCGQSASGDLPPHLPLVVEVLCKGTGSEMYTCNLEVDGVMIINQLLCNNTSR